MQVEDFFTHLLQRVVPKHDTQARAEVTVTRRFLENFSADQACLQHLSAHSLTFRQPRADAVAAGLPQAMPGHIANLISTPCEANTGYTEKSLLHSACAVQPPDTTLLCTCRLVAPIRTHRDHCIEVVKKSKAARLKFTCLACSRGSWQGHLACRATTRGR